jgi:nitrate reductase NapD
MNICGIVISVRPEGAADLRAGLSAFPGVEVYDDDGKGRFIATVEDNPLRSAGETMLALNDLKGVIGTSLVYHHFEPTIESGVAQE